MVESWMVDCSIGKVGGIIQRLSRSERHEGTMLDVFAVAVPEACSSAKDRRDNDESSD